MFLGILLEYFHFMPLYTSGPYIYLTATVTSYFTSDDFTPKLYNEVKFKRIRL